METYNVLSMKKTQCESKKKPFDNEACQVIYKSSKLLKEVKNNEDFTECTGSFIINKKETSISGKGVVLIDGKNYRFSNEENKYNMRELVNDSNEVLSKNDMIKKYTDTFSKTPNLSRMLKEEKERVEGEENTLYIAVVANHSYIAELGSLEQVYSEIALNFTTVSNIYSEELGIILIVAKIILKEEHTVDEKERPTMGWNMRLPGEAENILTSFANWRTLQKENYPIYHLLMGKSFRDNKILSTVGMAFVSTACATFDKYDGKEIGIFPGVSYTLRIENQFLAITHELAHNLGAMHDCTRNDCSMLSNPTDCCKCDGCDCEGRYIMNPIITEYSVTYKKFSSCTKKQMVGYLKNKSKCLKDPLKNDIKVEPICGNGIREEGEECDCGDDESCASSECCLPGCILKPGAECSDDNDGCCRDCKIIPKSENYICNKTSDTCSYDSICSGDSERCPKPKKHKDGSKCEFTDTDGSKCMDGLCTGKNRQCFDFTSSLGYPSKKACSGVFSGCKMYCDTPGYGCIDYPYSYLDGTSCGIGGTCYEGQCKVTFKGFMGVSWSYILGIVSIIVIILIIYIIWRRRSRRSTN
eukprot:GHVP01069998.1.p1 GENE.GHVP01069998.1~~GHVP01069998.1.p1  ORF type:complete len:634 (+),score=71.10 GHVP01069998.1:148-1902(+)